MAGTVFFSVSMSLDGYIAPDSPAEPMGRQWMELQQWAFPLRFFRENLKLGEGGEEGPDKPASRPHSIRPARPPEGVTSASRAEEKRSCST